jgi:SNF2 family DNA or RNA helicase
MNAAALADLKLPGVEAANVSLDTGTPVGDSRLYDWQRERAGRLVAAPRGQILVATPGLGKTAMAVAAADEAVPDDRIVVVAPASLLLTWRREIQKWQTVPGEVYVVQGKVDYDAAEAARWIVVSWDKAVNLAADWGKGWPLWILDESVLTKSRRSHRYKALRGGTVVRKGEVVAKYSGILKGVERVWLLSGSPTTRYADDLWAQLNLIWPYAFPSYWRFAERYCVIEETPWGKKITATRESRNAAAENDDLIMIIQQEDVHDLPEYLFDPPIEVTLKGKQAKAYRKMHDAFVADLDGTEVVAANEIARLMKLQQIASCWDGQSAKGEALADVIRSYEPPYLIWTHWIDTAADLYQRLNDAGVDTRFITGQTPHRDALIEGYKAGKFEALVLSLGVGKFGHTLTNTRTVVYVDKSWNADDYYQSLHRVRRIGLKHSPVVVSIKAPGTVDELIEANLEGKLGGISRLTRSDLATLLAGLGKETT